MPQGAKMRNVQRTVRRRRERQPHVSDAPRVSAPQAYRGEALGLPAAGPGSLAPTGARLLAFVVDALASGLVAALFVPHHGGRLASPTGCPARGA